MAAIPYLYRRLRGLGLPEAQAQRFSDGESLTIPFIEELDPEAELGDAVAKINEILAALLSAGAMDEEE